MEGYLPVSVGHQNFDKEGDLPTFTIRVKNENGTTSDRKYKMNGPIVRRALAPGEEPQKQAPAKAAAKEVARKAKPARRRRR